MHTIKNELTAFEMLTARSDFVALNKSGTRWVSRGLVIQIRENDRDIIRTGFTVTKKTHKSAVKRNRIKRRLRSVAADVLSRHGKRGYDYVLIGRMETATRDYETLIKDLKWCLRKTGYFVENTGG